MVPPVKPSPLPESFAVYTPKAAKIGIKIIVTLANQFRLMYQAKIMNESGYSEKDIATELGEHPYRVKLAIMKARNYSDKSLLDNLKKLGEINLNAKKGLVDSAVALELFILGL